MELNSVEEVLDRFPLVPSIDDIYQAINVLAKEIKNLKKLETQNRLLIEHEEAVRTKVSKPFLGGKSVEVKFKIGDIVEYNPIGTKLLAKAKIVNVRKRRFDIEILQNTNGVGLRGARRYVGGKQLRFYASKEL